MLGFKVGFMQVWLKCLTVLKTDNKGYVVSKSENVKINTYWTHRNGAEYRVINIANEYADEANKEKYPVTIIYQGENGKVWARPLSDWHRSFKQWPSNSYAVDKQESKLMDWVDFGSKGDDQSQTKKTNRGGRPIHAQERQHGLRGHIDLD